MAIAADDAEQADSESGEHEQTPSRANEANIHPSVLYVITA